MPGLFNQVEEMSNRQVSKVDDAASASLCWLEYNDSELVSLDYLLETRPGILS
jgi:hypothetical protein